MRYLLSSSCLLLLFSCSNAYKNLHRTSGDINVAQRFKPLFSVALYKAEINITGNYLSGLLLIKKMPDSSTRMLFSNETGFKFFDFEFSKNGDFKVHYILEKMNRKAVVKTLRRDFELVLMEHLDTREAFMARKGQLVYYGFPHAKGINYYIADSTGNELIRMERGSKTKAVVTAIAKNYINRSPDTVGITHHNINFTIGLKKIER